MSCNDTAPWLHIKGHSLKTNSVTSFCAPKLGGVFSKYTSTVFSIAFTSGVAFRSLFRFLFRRPNPIVCSRTACFLPALVVSYSYWLLHDGYFLGSSKVTEKDMSIAPHCPRDSYGPTPVAVLLRWHRSCQHHQSSTSWACWIWCVAIPANHIMNYYGLLTIIINW